MQKFKNWSSCPSHMREQKRHSQACNLSIKGHTQAHTHTHAHIYWPRPSFMSEGTEGHSQECKGVIKYTTPTNTTRTAHLQPHKAKIVKSGCSVEWKMVSRWAGVYWFS